METISKSVYKQSLDLFKCCLLSSSGTRSFYIGLHLSGRTKIDTKPIRLLWESFIHYK